MIVGIEGLVEKIEPMFIHLNVNGVIYEINISLNTSNSITQNRVKLLITQIIREDTNLLFGFIDRDEKRVFDRLIKISGIGSKVAMAICSTFSPATFGKIVTNRDVKSLKKVVGIGEKSASRILVELADFTINSDNSSSINNAIDNAILALESLGFKQEQIKKALIGASGDTSEVVKYGLKNLQRL